MKKTTLFAPLALTLALGLMTGCTAAAMNSSSSAAASDVAPAGSPSSTVSAGIAGSAGSDEYIAQADAENIALTDAGLTADSVSGMYGRLDYDDGRAVYDIEFWTDTAEYDYEIDAVSGEILSMDQDAENYTPRRKPERQRLRRMDRRGCRPPGCAGPRRPDRRRQRAVCAYRAGPGRRPHRVRGGVLDRQQRV